MVADREKILKQLAGIGIALDMDGHHADAKCIRDARALLKEQEPKPVKIVKNAYDYEFYYCPNCDRQFYDFYKKPVYCDRCGQEVKWK